MGGASQPFFFESANQALNIQSSAFFTLLLPCILGIALRTTCLPVDTAAAAHRPITEAGMPHSPTIQSLPDALLGHILSLAGWEHG
jgi:hypothetical protein